MSEVEFLSNEIIIKVEAFWDREAQVWTTSDCDLPGLATEAPTLEDLTQKLRIMVPELIQLNQVLSADKANTFLIEVIGHRQELVEVT